MHHKQKRSFSLLFLFFFIPTSLFLLFFFFFLPTDPPLPQPPSINHKEEAKPPLPIPSIPHYPQKNPIFSRRRTTHKARLKFLFHQNTTHFSTRASNFLSSDCTPRFFMTWIASLDSFGPRELFTIESLFRAHPNACLLILSPSLDSSRGTRILKPFINNGFNVAALAPDFAFLLRETPAELWFARLRRGEVDFGQIPIGQNLSNLLRLALLYKYGGIYIDTDVIILRSVLSLGNTIGAQAVDTGSGNWTRLNNAVMVFDRDHPLLLEFIREFSQTFDGSKWGHNGPYLVSRVVSRVLLMEERSGFEFTVLPPAAFYPVDWSRIKGLFCGPRGGRHSRWVKAKLRSILQSSFVLHLWNRESSRLKVEEGSIIRRIMSDCCVFCNSSL